MCLYVYSRGGQTFVENYQPGEKLYQSVKEHIFEYIYTYMIFIYIYVYICIEMDRISEALLVGFENL